MKNNKKIIKFLKCISDPTRFKILRLIAEDTLCVCELTEILNRTQPCISQHISKFKELNLVNEKKDKQWSYYSLNKEIYQNFITQLDEIQTLSLENLGFKKTGKRFAEVKSKDLCSIKNNER